MSEAVAVWPARRLTESRAKRISAGNEPRDGRGGVTTITGIGDIWTGCSAGTVILRREDDEGSRYAGDTTEMSVRGSYCVQPSPPRLYKSRNVTVAELDNAQNLASHCATELVSYLLCTQRSLNRAPSASCSRRRGRSRPHKTFADMQDRRH